MDADKASISRTLCFEKHHHHRNPKAHLIESSSELDSEGNPAIQQSKQEAEAKPWKRRSQGYSQVDLELYQYVPLLNKTQTT